MGERLGDRVLLVNDDGIDAPGMEILERVASTLFEDVWVVAPEDNRSGASHSLSIHAPIRVTRRDERHFSVRGTPTECTMLAVHELIPGDAPMLCISGVNRGPNLAEDAAYSGTIAAAREAALLGIPAIAVSQVFAREETHFSVGESREIPWETSEQWLEATLRACARVELDAGVFLNVNFPGVGPDEVEGLRATIQGRRPPGCFLPELRHDGRGNPYYWIMLSYEDGDAHPDSDLKAIAENHVSITPMNCENTAYALREEMVAALEDA